MPWQDASEGQTLLRASRWPRSSVDESYIWPDTLGRDEVAAASQREIVAVCPHRSEVSLDVGGHLFSAAEREIGGVV
jgi:hypothetical protein